MDGGVQVTALERTERQPHLAGRPQAEVPAGNAFGGGPAFWNDRLYVATGYAQVLALDRPTQGDLAPECYLRRCTPHRRWDGRVFAVTRQRAECLGGGDGKLPGRITCIPRRGLLGGASPRSPAKSVIAPLHPRPSCFALRVENGRAVWTDNLAATLQRFNAVAASPNNRGRPVIDHDGYSPSAKRAHGIDRSAERRPGLGSRRFASSHSPWSGRLLFSCWPTITSWSA